MSTNVWHIFFAAPTRRLRGAEAAWEAYVGATVNNVNVTSISVMNH